MAPTSSNPRRKSNTDDTVGKTGLREMNMLCAPLLLVTCDLQGSVSALCIRVFNTHQNKELIITCMGISWSRRAGEGARGIKKLISTDTSGIWSATSTFHLQDHC